MHAHITFPLRYLSCIHATLAPLHVLLSSLEKVEALIVIISIYGLDSIGWYAQRWIAILP